MRTVCPFGSSLPLSSVTPPCRSLRKSLSCWPIPSTRHCRSGRDRSGDAERITFREKVVLRKCYRWEHVMIKLIQVQRDATYLRMSCVIFVPFSAFWKHFTWTSSSASEVKGRSRVRHTPIASSISSNIFWWTNKDSLALSIQHPSFYMNHFLIVKDHASHLHTSIQSLSSFPPLRFLSHCAHFLLPLQHSIHFFQQHSNRALKIKANCLCKHLPNVKRLS